MKNIDYRTNTIWTVYVHINKLNHKTYVGITSNKPEERWQNGNGYRKQIFFKAIQKYGWDNFEHEIIAEHLTKDEASNMEIVLISKLNSTINGYNMASGGLNQPKIETREIYQFDLHGNFIAEYKSIAEASKKYNIPSPNIVNTCMGKVNQAGKYIWKYKSDISNIEDFKNFIDISIYDNFEPIYQFDMNQNFIKEYSSASEASRVNPKWYVNSILDSCRGKYKYAAGYIWRFKKDIADINEFKKEKINFSIDYFKGNPVIQYDSNWNIIKRYNCANDAAKELNCDSHTITFACSGRTDTGLGYFWRYDGDIPESNRISKPVLQFSLDGKLLNEYESVLEVHKKLGYKTSSITSVCAKGKGSNNFIWLYKENYHGQSLSGIAYKSNTTPVIQLSLDGEYIQRFNKINDAAKYINKSYTCIKDTCRGRQKTCGSFKWMYETDYLKQYYSPTSDEVTDSDEAVG